MANNILLGQYLETTSVVHRLDPRTKIVSMILMMMSFLILDTFIGYVIASCFVVSILILSKIPFHVVGRGLKPILFILMFTFLYHALLTKGSVIWSWSFIKVTEEGLQNGVRFVWRIVLLILLALY